MAPRRSVASLTAKWMRPQEAFGADVEFKLFDGGTTVLERLCNVFGAAVDEFRSSSKHQLVSLSASLLAEPDPRDIIQGDLEDCYFLSAISVLAHSNKERVRAQRRA